MGTDFTQDAVLHFLQSHGGSAKNSELVSHFRGFIRDNVDRDRNRELFKKFVNSVATVKQVDGVSHVVLRKKFRGHVGGGGGAGAVGASGPPRLPPAERSAERKPEKATSTPAPPGDGEPTILPAAGIMVNNNNKVDSQFNLKQDQQQIIMTQGVPVRPSAVQVVRQTPNLSEPPAPDQWTKAGHSRVDFAPSPEVPSGVRHRGETSQQVVEPPRGRDAPLQPKAGPHLHQDLPLRQIPHQTAPRRMRHRPSYKTAVSRDDDDEEDDEEQEDDIPMRPGSTGGAWPINVPLGDTRSGMSASTPSIIDPPVPPSVVSSSFSSSSSTERMIPKIYVQNVERDRTPSGHLGWGLESEPGLRAQSGVESTRRSLPLETERYVLPQGVAREVSPHRHVHTDRRYSQPAGVQMEQRRGQDPRQGTRLSSSQGNIFSPSPEARLSGREWPVYPRPASPRSVSPRSASPRPASPRSASPRPVSPRESGWTSSGEDLRPRAEKEWGGAKIQEVLHRAQKNKAESDMYRAWHHSTGNLLDYQEPVANVPPFHYSTDHLHDDRHSTGRVLPWHLSTGDLYDDRGDAGSSDGSTSSPPPHLRPAVARRLSSQMRSRMCRSMGTDLDQLLQEEARATGGSEAARLNRLHMISSSLSLRYMSSSSLSSCSTPPRSHSMADLIEGTEQKGLRRSLPSTSSVTAPQETSNKQSLVPLEPREHTWLVNGAAGAWPDIYALFREDTSLLNRQDFISGFTVLHWIAKHGDHRVLNTLWYGVQKAGLTFNVNARSSCGHTPLHIAAMHGNKNVMRLLVGKFNADVKLRDTAGKRPWQYLSSSTQPDVFQMLGAPARAALGGGGGAGSAGTVDTSWRQEQQQHQRRRKRHHLSFAPADRRKSSSGTVRVKRSSSIAAFLKHKSLQHFRGQSDASA